MFSVAQSQCLACAGGRDMHYAGKKEIYLHLVVGGNFVFSHFSFLFFPLWYIQSHFKKLKRSPFVSFISFYL